MIIKFDICLQEIPVWEGSLVLPAYSIISTAIFLVLPYSKMSTPPYSRNWHISSILNKSNPLKVSKVPYLNKNYHLQENKPFNIFTLHFFSLKNNSAIHLKLLHCLVQRESRWQTYFIIVCFNTYFPPFFLLPTTSTLTNNKY